MKLEELYPLYGEADMQAKIWNAKAQDYQRQILEIINAERKKDE